MTVRLRGDDMSSVISKIWQANSDAKGEDNTVPSKKGNHYSQKRSSG